MNLLICIIEEQYAAVVNKRVEESYQKRCSVLCELNEVFGKIAKPKTAKILITRVWINEPDFNNKDEHQKALSKVVRTNHVDSLKLVHELQQKVSKSNNEVQ